MWWKIREWRRKKNLDRVRMDRDLWESVRTDIPILDSMAPDKAFQLRDLASLFCHEKDFEGIHGLEVDEFMRGYVATLACIPVLNFGLSALDAITSIILYPSEFVPDTEEVDEAGIVHRRNEALSGEAWQNGPVVLSWEDVHASGQGSGYNVVIHEIAHILDMRNGEANGFPPLPRYMDSRAWSEAFRTAWKDARKRINQNGHLPIGSYATESPAEFFAVCCEYFFECPHIIEKNWPGVFEQLSLYFEQPQV
ncbi:zinc-dependent peptidase [Desulfobotulus mexicanus]|nr:M90 family metallopeptidase [Desulfobotulus mexicanus]